MTVSNAAQEWNADRYAHNAHFVPALGQPVVQLLKPLAGEDILDLGCGDGVLTEQIASAGAKVLGVDASAEMIAAAKQRGLDAHVMDGLNLNFDSRFDAVFSNAALHWMKSDPDKVIAGVWRALKPGGRFVGEMGGHGCVAAIIVAMLTALQRRGVDTKGILPWYFPTVDDYRARLERVGFVVDYIELIPRPTPLPTAMTGWMETFAEPLFGRLPKEQRAAARDEAIELVRPVLCDEQGRWTADYIRLRFATRRPA
jgi:trans-aconitate methyltransferase